MRLIFMGTPEFAVPSLAALADAGHDIGAVITRPDRPRRSRSSSPEPSAIKREAQRRVLPVLQPVSIRGVEQHNLVAWAGPAATDGLILSGHVDTVPFADQPGWTRPPLALTVEDDRIWGRGTADMKGFLALAINQLASLDPARLEPYRRPPQRPTVSSPRADT